VRQKRCYKKDSSALRNPVSDCEPGKKKGMAEEWNAHERGERKAGYTLASPAEKRGKGESTEGKGGEHLPDWPREGEECAGFEYFTKARYCPLLEKEAFFSTKWGQGGMNRDGIEVCREERLCFPGGDRPTQEKVGEKGKEQCRRIFAHAGEEGEASLPSPARRENFDPRKPEGGFSKGRGKVRGRAVCWK